MFALFFCFMDINYSKNPHIRTQKFGGQAEQVLLF